MTAFILPVLTILGVFSALVALLSFVLYLKTRSADRGHPDESPDTHRLAELDRKEQRYRTIHFISLFLFVVLGVLILVILSNRAD